MRKLGQISLVTQLCSLRLRMSRTDQGNSVLIDDIVGVVVVVIVVVVVVVVVVTHDTADRWPR